MHSDALSVDVHDVAGLRGGPALARSLIHPIVASATIRHAILDGVRNGPAHCACSMCSMSVRAWRRTTVATGSLDQSSAERWARLREDVRRCQLRRGAWYPVLSLAPDEAVLEVRRKTVIVPLAYLEVVRSRPKSWTLIPSERYAVCPNCAGRVALGRPPERLRCPGCHGLFEVDLNHHQIAPA